MPAASPNPGYDEALATLLRAAPALPAVATPLDQALGRVLRGDVHADRDQPAFNRAAVDGYAVAAASVRPGEPLAVVGEVACGHAPPVRLDPASGAVRIATGAMLPVGYDACVPFEICECVTREGRELVRLGGPAVEPWRNVHRRGVDAARGAVVLHSGTVLGAQHLGIAATVGVANPLTAEPPRVTVLTTGDEVFLPETPTEQLPTHALRNSNGPVLLALLRLLGVTRVTHEHVPDDAERTRAAAREALARSHLVVTAGGVSVGARDHLPWAWRELGLRTLIHGVAIQPGKPLLVAAEPGHAADQDPDQPADKLVLGLPGNPVSVLATAHLFLWPLLRRMCGAAAPLPWRDVSLATPAQTRSGRQLFRLVRLGPDGAAHVLPWHGSGDLMHAATAQGWVRLPLCEETLPVGAVVPFLPLIAAP